MKSKGSFFRALGHGRTPVVLLLSGFVLTVLATAALVTQTANLRFERDVYRMAFNDNLALLRDIKVKAGVASDTLKNLLSAPVGGRNEPYIVVSIEERKLWYKQGDSVLFETRVATGSGKQLVQGTNSWRFQTPRGRMSVISKETNPVWVPPDWHFIEQAKKKGLEIVKLDRGESVRTADGGTIFVQGSQVVKQSPDGQVSALGGGEDREIITGGQIIIPPFGTNARRYEGVLGTHRLNLGDGYALHGTNKPESIGQAVSHGCVRLLNEDIELLHKIVPVGTAVFIY